MRLTYMEKKQYENPAVLAHDVELEQLLIEVTSGETTEEQLSKMREDLMLRSQRELESAEYGNLW